MGAALSPDAGTLLTAVATQEPPEGWELIAIDTRNGTQRWRKGIDLRTSHQL